MAKLSIKERKAWEKRLNSGTVKMWKGDLYKEVTGFSYPRGYEKDEQPLDYGGDSKLNGFYVVNPPN